MVDQPFWRSAFKTRIDAIKGNKLTVQRSVMREVRREEGGRGSGRSCRGGGRGCILVSAAPYRRMKARRDPVDTAEGGEPAEVGRRGSDRGRAGRVLLKVLDVHQTALVVLLDVVRLGTPRAALPVRAAPGRLRADVVMIARHLRGRGATGHAFRRVSGVGGRLHAIVHTSGGESSDGRRLDVTGEVDRFVIPRRRSRVGSAVRGHAARQSSFLDEVRRRRQGVSRGLVLALVLGQRRRIDGETGYLSDRRVRRDERR